MTDQTIPEGFERHFRPSPLTDPWEPIYQRKTSDAIILGLWLAKPHTNSRGFVHGGLIAALADKAMGHSCGHHARRGLGWSTVSMADRFHQSGAQSGQWLTVETDVIKTGGTLCFAQCAVTADGEMCARANATFRVVKKEAALRCVRERHRLLKFQSAVSVTRSMKVRTLADSSREVG